MTQIPSSPFRVGKSYMAQMHWGRVEVKLISLGIKRDAGKGAVCTVDPGPHGQCLYMVYLDSLEEMP